MASTSVPLARLKSWRSQVAVVVHVQDDGWLDSAGRPPRQPFAPAQHRPLVVQRGHDAALRQRADHMDPKETLRPHQRRPALRAGSTCRSAPLGHQFEVDVAAGFRCHRVLVAEVVPQVPVPEGRIWGSRPSRYSHALLPRCTNTAARERPARQRALGQSLERFPQTRIGIHQLILGPPVKPVKVQRIDVLPETAQLDEHKDCMEEA